MAIMIVPSRKRLPHEVPLWIDPEKEIYFITLCCERREENQLARRDIANAVFETVRHPNLSGI